MLKKRLLFLVVCVVVFSRTYCQKLPTLEVNLSKPANGLSAPAKTNLDVITLLANSIVTLAEVKSNKRANLSLTRNINWQSNPGKICTLKYRLIVYNRGFLKEKVESGTQ